ncbi:hypothetical protein RCL1_001064 [Eukaryota sp. TZLM3-RCL]
MTLQQCQHCLSQVEELFTFPCKHAFCHTCFSVQESDRFCANCETSSSNEDIKSCDVPESPLRQSSFATVISISELGSLDTFRTTPTTILSYCTYNSQDTVLKQFTRLCDENVPLACFSLVKSSGDPKYFVPVLGVTENPAGIVMSFCSPSLQDLLQAGRTFSVCKVISIASSLFSALVCLHSLNLVHGEICPKNIYLSEEFDEVRLGNLDGAFIAQSKTYNSAFDVYSLGILLYSLVTCTYPIKQVITQGDFESLYSRNYYRSAIEGYSSSFLDLIVLMTHVNPIYRPTMEQIDRIMMKTKIFNNQLSTTQNNSNESFHSLLDCWQAEYLSTVHNLPSSGNVPFRDRPREMFSSQEGIASIKFTLVSNGKLNNSSTLIGFVDQKSGVTSSGLILTSKGCYKYEVGEKTDRIAPPLEPNEHVEVVFYDNFAVFTTSNSGALHRVDCRVPWIFGIFYDKDSELWCIEFVQ